MTLAPTAPTPPAPAVDPTRPGLGALARTTPGRLTILLALLVVLGLAFGTAMVVGVQQRGGRLDEVRSHSGPLTVQAQQLYRSLSDADATAASSFLTGGVESASAARRYQQDIAEAGKALATASNSGGANARVVQQLTSQLPVYTGLVETARVYNRLGIPLGAAYLREASGLMRDKLLPAAKSLYQAETARLTDDRSAAAGFPWVAIPVGLLLLAGLMVGQVHLSRRTNRVFNRGLLVGCAAAVVSLLWLTASWGALASHLGSARDTGSAQVEAFAQIRLTALQARADESLTLVARGNGAAFEKDFRQRMTDLVGTNGSGGLIGAARSGANDAQRRQLDTVRRDVRDWQAAHAKVRSLDDGGRYPEAVQVAIGSGAGSAADAFGNLDRHTASAIEAANGRFTDQASAAASSQTGAAIGLGLLAAVCVLGTTVGLQRRVAEYR
ncbi:hypothetical protein Athai_19610 [Actinocatenispora thailandica]|uniref:Secreted protein n=1 Tax=Actinocatenispora thailandica TaxID=227318 RepID=A0A7R7HW28_9ACTN|nr:hypothetical protein [Actinocatenispora thailandica]BCJ34458.1 hypothetical protein Athai_19610 [Actinocatenispora thailandica]